jgi:hypothetical protein
MEKVLLDDPLEDIDKELLVEKLVIIFYIFC